MIWRRTGASWHWPRTVGLCGLAMALGVIMLAPVLAPNRPGDQFHDRVYAPPMSVHVLSDGSVRAPFVYGQVLEDRIASQYGATAPLTLSWLSNGHVVSLAGDGGPLLLLGADPLGRDVFSRLLYGGQLSLGVTVVGALGALMLGALIGGLAGSLGGRSDTWLMLAADFVLVLPGVYLVLVLRAMLPLTLVPAQVFWLMALLFAAAGWPHVARGVRAIVATERTRDYAEAARAAGAGPLRLLRHLLPAARPFLATEIVLLVPALLVAEATISFLGLGFPEPTPSWGTMLQDASNVTGMLEAPWMLAPAAALFLVVLAVQMAAGSRASSSALLGGVPDGAPWAATSRRS